MSLLQQVYADDIEVTLKIDGEPWNLIEARVELTKASTPDYVDMIIQPKESTVLPDVPTRKKKSQGEGEEDGGLVGAEFTLDVDNEFDSGPRDTEITRIFNGKLANLSNLEKGAWEGIAFDPSHQAFDFENEGNFVNSTIDISGSVDSDVLDDPEYERRRISYSSSSKNTAGQTQIAASNLAQRIVEQAPIKDYAEPNIKPKEDAKVGEQPDGTPVYSAINTQLSFAEDEITVKKALEAITNSTKATWWFDRSGKFHIGAPQPGNPIEVWNLKFIIDTDAGLNTPAWRSVQVIGSGVASEDGWDKSNLNSGFKLIETSSLANDGKLYNESLKKPTFTYRNLEIQTQQEAQNVARAILGKLRDQQQEGKITVVGFPEVRPLDAVQMPQAEYSDRDNYSELQPMGGARYGVVKVVHKINGDNGFVTDIHIGGLTQEESTLFNDERVDELADFSTDVKVP